MTKADFGSAFLRAEDLILNGSWSEATFTIENAHPPNSIHIRDGQELLDKECLSFIETDQKLVMGKLNWRLMRYAMGIEAKEQCVGREITLYAAKGSWFGEPECAALRIRIPKGQVRPNVKKKIMGIDLTGTRFKGPPTKPQHKKDDLTEATRLIDGCKQAGALLLLLTSWTTAKPIIEKKDKWLKILSIVYKKIEREGDNWPDTHDLMGLLAHIQDEIQAEQ